MPSDFLFRSVIPVSDTWTSGSKNRRHPISARLLAPAQTYSVGTGILYSPRYPRTDANLPRCVRTGILTRIHYPQTDAKPPHRVGTDILQPVHYPHTDASHTKSVGTDIPTVAEYSYTDAKPYSVSVWEYPHTSTILTPTQTHHFAYV